MKNLVLILTLIFSQSVFSKPLSGKKILFVVTGSSELILKNQEKYKTGYWLEEFAVPYQMIEEKGVKITIATPLGSKPTMDGHSTDVDADGKPLYWPSVEEMERALQTKNRVLDRGEIADLSEMNERDFDKFDAVFFPGGHGPMQDMMNNSDVDRLLRFFHTNRRLTALVCHAPIAVLSTENKGFLYKGYKMTAYSDSEESQTPVGPKMITTPQKELEQAGVIFVKGEDWQPNVVEDRELITGQNPASSKAIAEALIKRMAN